MMKMIRKIKERFGVERVSRLIEDMDDSFITINSHRFYFDRQELKLLVDKISNRELMVEVGSLAGFSTRLFSIYFEKVISVDPYIPNYDAKDINADPNRLALAKELFMLRFFDDPRVSHMCKVSAEAALEFENNSLDFVYIDGGHDYASVRADIQAWKPKVKVGSCLAGDDYDWPGVSRAVKELLPSHEVLGGRWIARV